MSDGKLRVLGLERDRKACNYYRILNPLGEMNIQGMADTALIEFDSQMDSDDNLRKVFESDIVLVPRPSSEEWFSFVKACRKAGKIVVADYDDDPFTCDPFNPYYRWIGVEEWSHPDFGWVWRDGMKGPDGTKWFDVEKNINRRDMLRAAFKRADLVTCTTSELQEVFLKINPNTIVLPNFIDLSCYQRPEFMKKKVRIGWQGGCSHYRDLHFIKDVLAPLSHRDDIEIVYFGDTRFLKLLEHIKNLEVHDFVNHSTYPYKLSLLNLDIGLCPLIDNEFNRRKSAIKYFEYAAVGAATISSDVPPYSHAIKNFEDGILVPNDKTLWIEALEGLIKDRKKILELSKNALDNINKNYLIEKNAHLWLDAYNKVIERDMVKV